MQAVLLLLSDKRGIRGYEEGPDINTNIRGNGWLQTKVSVEGLEVGFSSIPTSANN
jgi:hypothetical protein